MTERQTTDCSAADRNINLSSVHLPVTLTPHLDTTWIKGDLFFSVLSLLQDNDDDA